MSDSDFRNKVLLSLDDILNYLTEPDKDAIELRRITSNQETLIQTLESELKKLKIDFLKMKDENEELHLALKSKQQRLLVLENNLSSFDSVHKESESAVHVAFVEQIEKKDKIYQDDEKINRSILPEQSTVKIKTELFDFESGDFPEKLLDNDGFSLNALEEEKIEKKIIIHNFKVFILMLTYVMHEDDSESFSEFLDLKQNEIDESLRQEAYLKWKSEKGQIDYIDEIYDILDKIPQKNRYTSLIEKFENFIS